MTISVKIVPAHFSHCLRLLTCVPFRSSSNSSLPTPPCSNYDSATSLPKAFLPCVSCHHFLSCGGDGCGGGGGGVCGEGDGDGVGVGGVGVDNSCGGCVCGDVVVAVVM